ncbi:MAG: hypothetical protein ACKOW8_10355, partial [Flavobacteriales bacterium]
LPKNRTNHKCFMLMVMACLGAWLTTHSQTITVHTKGMQVYFRPKDKTLAECQAEGLIDHQYFGNGNCQYIFDLDKNIFIMKPEYVDWQYTSNIIEKGSTENLIDLKTEEGTTYIITNKNEYNKELFLIEYFDLPDKVEGRFALQQDFVVDITQ